MSRSLIRGFDYQFLVAWHYALELLSGRDAPTLIKFEAKKSGSVDDVVVHWHDRRQYIQVKYSVDGRSMNSSEWWLDRSGSSRSSLSLLEKFWKSWILLREHDYPLVMDLFTNRSRKPDDPVMECIDGDDDRLVPRLRAGGPKSNLGIARAKWAEHLKVSEQDMFAMLERLRILDGQGSFASLERNVRYQHLALGLSGSTKAVELGLNAVKKWGKTGRLCINRAKMKKEIDALNLQKAPPRATLRVWEIERGRLPGSSTMQLNWSDLFPGADRRRISDQGAWDRRMGPDLANAAAEIRRRGYREVLVEGAMRLPSWFAVGVHFPDVKGWRVSCVQRDDVWDSSAAAEFMNLKSLKRRPTPIEQGPDLAIGLSVTTSIAREVRQYVRGERLPVKTYLDLQPAGGAGSDSLPDASAARRWAEAVRDAVRKSGASRVHLFMAAPAGAAMLLGHFWNYMPETQLYAPMPRGDDPAYAPAYTFPSS